MGVPVKINSLGLRDDEISVAKPDGVVRILMLGDLVTFGWGVLQEDTVSAKLETLLNATPGAKPVEVVNSGVGNYNAVQEITYFLNRGAELNPDIVVLNYFINDAEPTPQRHDVSILEHSYLAIFAMGRIDALMRTYFGKENWQDYYSGLYRPEASGWQEALKSIEALIAYCQSHGIRLLIANYPELHQLNPYPFDDVTAAVAEEAQRPRCRFRRPAAVGGDARTRDAMGFAGGCAPEPDRDRPFHTAHCRDPAGTVPRPDCALTRPRHSAAPTRKDVILGTAPAPRRLDTGRGR